MTKFHLSRSARGHRDQRRPYNARDHQQYTVAPERADHKVAAAGA
jgi:hypothetical protein